VCVCVCFVVCVCLCGVCLWCMCVCLYVCLCVWCGVCVFVWCVFVVYVCVFVCLYVCVVCSMYVCACACALVCARVNKRNLLATEAIYCLSISEKLFVVTYKLCFNEILRMYLQTTTCILWQGRPLIIQSESLVNFLVCSEGQYNSPSFL